MSKQSGTSLLLDIFTLNVEPARNRITATIRNLEIPREVRGQRYAHCLYKLFIWAKKMLFNDAIAAV
jgi:hypothetical protein